MHTSAVGGHETGLLHLLLLGRSDLGLHRTALHWGIDKVRALGCSNKA